MTTFILAQRVSTYDAWKKVFIGISSLFVCAICFLFSCTSKQVVNSTLIGKWEAEYLVKADRDTTFYREGSLSPCAYILLPFDYNSGFELLDNTKGELIWCGRNKEQFFTWSFDKNVMRFRFGDQTASVDVEKVTDSFMDITVSNGDRYRMKKY